jgi:hypothetical protein
VNGREKTKKRHGILLFILIAIVLGLIAIIVASMTGPVGIEERFASAVGQHPDEDAGHENTGGGFSLEGNPLMYGIVVLILIIVCAFLYRKYRI